MWQKQTMKKKNLKKSEEKNVGSVYQLKIEAVVEQRREREKKAVRGFLLYGCKCGG